MDEDLVVRLHRIERQLTADRIALERRLDQLDRRLAELPTLIGAALDTKRSDTDSASAGGAPRAASRDASRASTATGTAPLDKTAAYLVALVELFAEAHRPERLEPSPRLATGSGDTIVRLRRGSTITAAGQTGPSATCRTTGRRICRGPTARTRAVLVGQDPPGG